MEEATAEPTEIPVGEQEEERRILLRHWSERECSHSTRPIRKRFSSLPEQEAEEAFMTLIGDHQISADTAADCRGSPDEALTRQ